MVISCHCLMVCPSTCNDTNHIFFNPRPTQPESASHHLLQALPQRLVSVCNQGNQVDVVLDEEIQNLSMLSAKAEQLAQLSLSQHFNHQHFADLLGHLHEKLFAEQVVRTGQFPCPNPRCQTPTFCLPADDNQSWVDFLCACGCFFKIKSKFIDPCQTAHPMSFWEALCTPFSATTWLPPS